MNLVGFSWRSVLAGVAAAVAVSVVMGLLGVALGAVVVDPMSNDPLSGLGMAFGIWSLVSLLLSMAVGGYVAGMLSPGRGAEHGFLVWATVLAVGVVFGGMAIGSAVSNAGGAVASMSGAVLDDVSDLAERTIEALPENVNLNVDISGLDDGTLAVLRDTGIPTLQPSYLRSQVQEAGGDLRVAVSSLRLNGRDFDQVIGTFMDKQRSRLDNINAEVDRNAAVTNLMQNRVISRPEAERLVDNALATYYRTADSARETLADAGRSAEEARTQLALLSRQVRAKLDDFNSALARSAFMAALAVVIGAAVASLCGMLGNRQSASRYVFVEERQEITAV